MLVGKEGRYDKPKYPCLVPGCRELAFQEEGGACKSHKMEKVAWLIRRVMTRPSPWAPSFDPGQQAGLSLDGLSGKEQAKAVLGKKSEGQDKGQGQRHRW